MPTPSREYSSRNQAAIYPCIHQVRPLDAVFAGHQRGKQPRGNAHGLPAAHDMRPA